LSTRRKVNKRKASFGQSHYGETDFTAVETPVRIGDEALAGLTPALIKIDVEGFELKTIQWAERDTRARLGNMAKASKCEGRLIQPK